ncbi:MAG: glyoxylate/hydroxypyruvate reductase A, partial [Variovorax sp.]
SVTQPLSAAEVVVDNLRRFEAGEPMVGLVDRSRGY